jgi:hypothetical protein
MPITATAASLSQAWRAPRGCRHGIVTITGWLASEPQVIGAGMAKISYRCHHFSAQVIQHAVWLYLRFSLSYRDVEDLLAERRLDLSYETIRRWVLKFVSNRTSCAIRQMTAVTYRAGRRS